MIATKVPTIYGVTLPADVRALLERLTVVVSFGVGGVATTPLECMGLAGYMPRLLFWMIFPVVATFVIIIGVCVSMALKKRKQTNTITTGKTGKVKDDDAHGSRFSLDDETDGPQKDATLLENVLPPFLTVMFVLYPLVTKVAFDGFPCYQFEGGRGWLIADVSIECGTPEHTSATMLAWIAVIVYPIGLMVLNLVLLIKARNAIINGKETPLSRSIAFLYREYDVQRGGLKHSLRPLRHPGHCSRTTGTNQHCLPTCI